jgi:hypothetical protein
MASTRNIALNFLALKTADFTYTVYRKKLTPDQVSVPGTRTLPYDCLGAPATSVERHRYEVSLQPTEGFEATRMGAWINPGLTDEVLHQALICRAHQSDLSADTELSERKFTREVAFVLGRHGDVREVMWLRAYGLQVVGRFGFLCQFAVRIPRDSSIPDKRRLELSLTHKNGRVNGDFYLDQYQKVELFLQRYFKSIAELTLHDGTQVEIEPRLSVVPSFTLARRTYVFRDSHEGKNQFFGLRDHGPFQPADPASRLVFVFAGEDRERSQHLFRALRGDIYSTFPGMESMFRTAITRKNVSGIEVPGFTNGELQQTCTTLKAQFPAERVVPVVLVPLTKHTSDEETAKYNAAKHAFISQGLASQFVDRKQTQDRNALKWSVSNIGLALFAKMGGVPWRVKPSTVRCLVVGIGQAHRVVNGKVERYLAYSVLTDSTGSYESIKILGNSPNEDEYIETLRTNLRQVLVSHADQYDSFVLHVTFSIKRSEIEVIQALLKELKGAEGSSRNEFVAIKFNDRNPFFGFSVDHNSRVPHEGTVAPLSQREYLIWFSGLSIDDSRIPKKPERPAHLRVLYPETPLPEADLKRVLQDAMNIAGANWRGFNAKSMPISVYYAKIIADYYAHFRESNLREVDFETVSETVSPWFL